MKSWYIVLLFIAALSFSSFGQDQYVKPQKGEGIHALLRRNNRDGKEYYQKFIELNNKKLDKNNSLKLGVTYLLPPLKETEIAKTENKKKEKEKRIEPLFGEKYAEYTIDSDRLKGTCFFLSSGHGGPDPGATVKINSEITLHEDEYAYDITLRMASYLLKQGATVHIIIQDPNDGIRDGEYLNNSNKETCMGDEIPLDQKARLKQRSDKINQLSSKSDAKYQRAVFVHLDSRAHKRSMDVFFYYCPESKKGEVLADRLRDTMYKKYNIYRRSKEFEGTISPRGLYVLKETTPVGVFVELGNICNNGRDRQRFLEKKNRQYLAEWLGEGLIKDFENAK